MPAATEPNKETYSPGLEGVIAGESAISTVTGGLRYRGYPITELADHCSFEEVGYLLLHGELPKKAELAAFHSRIAAARQIPDSLVALFKALPKNIPAMDACRTAISVLAHYDPEVNDNSTAANKRKAERLMGQIPVAVAAHYRITQGEEPIAPQDGLPIASEFLRQLTGKVPSHEDAKAFDVSLILYAEHEFNASTFTCRVVCSTMADLHSAIVAGVGALKGPLHGGANEKVMDILLATGGPDKADKWTRDALARKERIMGFGHRVYKTGDVRAAYLKKYAQEAAQRAGTEQWEKTAEIMEEIMAKEKNMYPNLDWPAGRLYHAMKLAIPLYTPIFVMSRITGWSAHFIEQAENNRLIRPRGLYTGPEVRTVVPLEQRT
jgi:2-methylcitrate synthase/citrate synthase II